MKIRATKTMAKYIAKFVKENKLAEEVEFGYANSYEYPMAYDYGAEMDYDEDRDEYRVIRVFYPYEYYAPVCIISTPLLHQRLREAGIINTVDKENFNAILRDIIEI